MFDTLRGPSGFGLLLSLAVLPWASQAEEPLESPIAIQASARAYLEEVASARALATGGIARIQVGTPDARLKVAACQALQASLPPGARRSGKTLVVVRCLDGRPWQVFLPAELHVEAPVWFTAHPIPAGRILELADLSQRTVDVGFDESESRPLTVAAGVALGQTTGRALAEGVVLHTGDFRDLGRVAPGDAVNVVYSGSGFNVTGEGRSVGAASPGQSLQVRMAGGSLVTGVLMDDHVVEIKI